MRVYDLWQPSLCDAAARDQLPSSCTRVSVRCSRHVKSRIVASPLEISLQPLSNSVRRVRVSVGSRHAHVVAASTSFTSSRGLERDSNGVAQPVSSILRCCIPTSQTTRADYNQNQNHQAPAGTSTATFSRDGGQLLRRVRRSARQWTRVPTLRHCVRGCTLSSSSRCTIHRAASQPRDALSVYSMEPPATTAPARRKFESCTCSVPAL